MNAFVPRVQVGPVGGVKQVPVPWARPQSGFTLLLESLLVLCARTGMAVAKLGRMTNGAAEALNGIIQTVKRKSCGFRTFE